MGDRYALYQLDANEENEPFLFQSYAEVQRMSRPIRVADYRLAYSGFLLPGDDLSNVVEKLKMMDLNSGMARALSTGDVIVLTIQGEKTGYYYDGGDCILFRGFFSESSGGKLTERTENYVIPGKAGRWRVIDSLRAEHAMFFLLESQNRDSSAILLDEKGVIVAENVKNGFDKDSVAAIERFLHPERSMQEIPRLKPELKEGQVLRSVRSEAGEARNCSMIDGVRNNRASREKGKRRSVRARLREKQLLLHGQTERSRILEKI